MDPGFSSMCILSLMGVVHEELLLLPKDGPWILLYTCRRMDPGFSSICILSLMGVVTEELLLLPKDGPWILLYTCRKMDPGFSSICIFSLMGVPAVLLLLPKDGPWILLYMHPFSDGCSTWGAAAIAEGWTQDSPLYLPKEWTLDSPLCASSSLMGVPEELLLLPKPRDCLTLLPKEEPPLLRPESFIFPPDTTLLPVNE